MASPAGEDDGSPATDRAELTSEPDASQGCVPRSASMAEVEKDKRRWKTLQFAVKAIATAGVSSDAGRPADAGAAKTEGLRQRKRHATLPSDLAEGPEQEQRRALDAEDGPHASSADIPRHQKRRSCPELPSPVRKANTCPEMSAPLKSDGSKSPSRSSASRSRSPSRERAVTVPSVAPPDLRRMWTRHSRGSISEFFGAASRRWNTLRSVCFTGDLASDMREAAGSEERAPSKDTRSEHEKSCERAAEWLELLRASPGALSQEDLEAELKDLLEYKNRKVQARLLHHAMAVSVKEREADAESVRRVLNARADVHGKASYWKGEMRNDLEAIHVAAGLGYVPVLQAIIDAVSQREGLDKVPDLVNRYCMMGSDKFYAPIHDAAYLGKADAVTFLLKHRADPSKQNREGNTPLHFIAKQSLLQGYETEQELEAMVRSMIKAKARLDARNLQNRIPLEEAVQDESSFPRRLLHFLAPSFQVATREPATAQQQPSIIHVKSTSSEGGSPMANTKCEHSFLEDMCVLSCLNTDAANQLSHHLSEDPDCHVRVRIDAQKDNAVDHMASLFHMAPEAAAKMLEILLVKPAVEDPGHHPIRTRASLWGLMYHKRMRCTYQADFKAVDVEQQSGLQVRDSTEKEKIRLPQWQWDSDKADKADWKDQVQTERWHADLVQTPAEDQERRDHVYDVDTKVVLLPNILDIDIFMALASTPEAHSCIFAKLSVQGIIYCCWDNLCIPVVYTRLFLNVVDLVVQGYWGLLNISMQSRGAGGSLWLRPSLWWSVVAASVLRDMLNMAWWYRSYAAKYAAHYAKYRAWQSNEKPQAAGEQGASSPASRPPSLHSLWRPQAFLTLHTIFEICLMVSKLGFVWLTFGTTGGAVGDAGQAMLTANTVLQLYKVIYMLRLTNFCKKISTILSAFSSGAICEVMVVTLLFFFSVCLAFAMLSNTPTYTSMGWLFLYRGLLFGDGDALDAMGLQFMCTTDEGGAPSVNNFTQTSVMLLATLLFNIVIMNLTTAVYSAEYDRLEKEAELHFQRERAKACCEILLSLQKIKLPPDDETSPGRSANVLQFLKGSCVFCVIVGILLHLKSHGRGVYCVQLASAVLLAYAQVVTQAVWMASDWFPLREDGEEGPEKEHFLWICYRSDFCEDQFAPNDLDKQVFQEVVEERLGKLDEFMSDRVVRLDAAIDSMNEAFEDKMNCLEARIEKLLQLQHSCVQAAEHVGEGLGMLAGLKQPMVTVDTDQSGATGSDDHLLRQPQVPRASSSGTLEQGLSQALQETSPGKSPVPLRPAAEDSSGLTSPSTPAIGTLRPPVSKQVQFMQSPLLSPQGSSASIGPVSPRPRSPRRPRRPRPTKRWRPPRRRRHRRRLPPRG